MFKDDRFISVLSGVVLMIAIGTVVQRGGPIVEYFTGERPAPVLKRDEAQTVAGELVRIDVLRNDEMVNAADAGRLVVVGEPACGKVFVRDGGLQYLPDTGCQGAQVLRYGLSGEDAAAVSGEVIVLVRPAPAEPQATGTAAAPAAPQAPAAPSAGPSPLSAPALPGGVDTAALPADAPTRAGGPQVSLAPDPGPMPAPGAGAAPAPETAMPTPRAPEALSAAEPRVGRAPAGLAAPAMPGGLDQAPSLGGAGTVGSGLADIGTGGAGGRPNLVAAGTGQLAPAPDSGGLDVGRAAAPVSQPSIAATRAPANPGMRLAEGRRGEFALTQNRGSLLARPGRASTEAAPSETLLARVSEAEAAPGRTAPVAALSGEGLALVAPTPAAPSLPLPSDGDTSLALAAPDPAPAPAGPGGPSRGAEPAPLRAAPSLGLDRISQLSPPPPSLDTAGTGLALARASDPSLPASVSLARVDRNLDSLATPDAPLGSIGAVPLAPMPTLGFGSGEQVALAAPDSGLGDVRNLGGGSLGIVPVDTAVPQGLSEPAAGADSGVDVAALNRLPFDPDAKAVEVVPGAVTGAGAGEGDTGSGDAVRYAGLPDAAAPCTTPPALTIDPQPAAVTEVRLDTPCHAGQVVLLNYSGIDLGIPIDAQGKGRIAVPGFERRSRASLLFPDGSALDFDLPFADIGRIERVALAWDLPVALELHGVPVGRQVGSPEHVHPGNPRSFEDIRRPGGGYLTSFRSIDGLGDNVEIYTHWVRSRGGSEVIKLMIDYASRRPGGSAETCGTGRYSAPDFTIIRSSRGEMDRPLNRRLSAVGCAEVAGLRSHLIESAVDDVIISKR